MATLTDQIAVVTGASKGIGQAIALGLANQGAIPCLIGRDAETLKKVAEIAKGTTKKVLIYKTDLTQEREIQRLATQIQQDCGRIAILVHSAGIISLGKIQSAPVKSLDLQYQTNLRAPYLLTQALLPLIRPCEGQIVFINSSIWMRAQANCSQYAATKYALKALADSLRDEVNADGIRVVSLFLGRTATPMQETVHELEGKAYDPDRLMQPQDVADLVIHVLGVPKSAEVTDINMRPMYK